MKNISEDFSAAIAVFLVALPLCLGIALASDAPLISGIIAGIIGGILVGLIGGSEVSVSGPAAGLVVVVAGSIQELGSYQLFSLALLIAGILQMVFALVGLHKFTKLIPQSVVKGMLSAIGILICIKEFPYLIGTKNSAATSIALHEAKWAILCVSGCTILAIFFWENLQKRKIGIKNIPSALIGVIFGTIVSGCLVFLIPDSMSNDDFVHLPRLLDHFTFYVPNIESLNLNLLKISFLIALIASVETLLCLEASLQLDPLNRPISQRKEIFAQGLANIVSGFVGGLPITAVILRTAANISSGARTRKATILHGCFIAIFAIFFVSIVNLVPLSSLAIVLVLVGYKLFSPKIFLEKKKKGNLSFSVFLMTIISILLTDLLVGVAVGTIFHYGINAFMKRGKNVPS